MENIKQCFAKFAQPSESAKKLTKAKFREFVLSIAELPMDQQQIELLHYHESYRGAEEQVDDIGVVGIRV